MTTWKVMLEKFRFFNTRNYK